MFHARHILPLAAIALLSTSCAKSRVAAETTRAMAATNPVTAAPQSAPRPPRVPEATLFVDGAPRGILRAPELKPSLTPRTIKTAHGEELRYSFADYLASLHVDVARVKAVHLYGSRVAVVDGDELRRHAEDFGFAFTNGDRGKPQMHFPQGMRVNTTIDLLSRAAVYIEKEPPVWHDAATGSYLAFADGKPIDGVPYAAAEQLKGTRVYVDGDLVAIVKRRELPDTVIAKRDGKRTEFSLLAGLASLGASTANVKAIDLLSGDDLVRRLDAPTWETEKSGMRFTMPAHSRGQIAMTIPDADGAKARVSSVQIFTKSAPPKRWLAPAEVVSAPEPDEHTRSAGEDDSMND